MEPGAHPNTIGPPSTPDPPPTKIHIQQTQTIMKSTTHVKDPGRTNLRNQLLKRDLYLAEAAGFCTGPKMDPETYSALSLK